MIFLLLHSSHALATYFSRLRFRPFGSLAVGSVAVVDVVTGAAGAAPANLGVLSRPGELANDVPLICAGSATFVSVTTVSIWDITVAHERVLA